MIAVPLSHLFKLIGCTRWKIGKPHRASLDPIRGLPRSSALGPTLLHGLKLGTEVVNDLQDRIKKFHCVRCILLRHNFLGGMGTKISDESKVLSPVQKLVADDTLGTHCLQAIKERLGVGL